MRVLIQRVKKGSVEVDNKIVSKINQGIVLFVGIENSDDNIDIEWICKMNKSLIDIEGDILIISQFTLHASTKKGNRPSYIKAAKGDFAKNIYDKFLIAIKSKINKEPKAGVFGADMLVKIENDGPVTIFMDSKNKFF
jgi:D-tyrosyl-tRNA(Tyr) deacylase